MKYITVVRVRLVRDGSVKSQDRPMAGNPRAVSALARRMVEQDDREYFLVLLMDVRGALVGINTVSVGSATCSVIHPREIFKPAILASAAGIVLAHNHPSGDPEPSPEDKVTTRRIVRAGKLLGIPVVDHVILGDSGRFWSFREHGLVM